MENIGRNDPCPCGSGKKYKKCCMNKSYLQRKQATILKGDTPASATASKIAILSKEKGVSELFQKVVMPTTNGPTASLKGKVSVGKPIDSEKDTN